MSEPQIVVVGAGPNGLVAAITLAAAGLRVTLWERHPAAGGGARTAELTQPGFQHDVCSSNFPLGAASPVFQALRLEERGLEWVHPDFPLAHPLDNKPAALLQQELAETVAALLEDGSAWQGLMSPLVGNWPSITSDFLGPLRLPSLRRSHVRFGCQALRSCHNLVQTTFRTEAAQALFGGLAAHGAAPLQAAGSAAFGLVLAAAGQIHGMPFVRTGAQALTSSLVNLAAELGVKIETGVEVNSWADLDDWPVKVLDLGPHAVAKLAEPVLAPRAVRRLQAFRYGLGVCKVDYALSEPVPWQDADCYRAGVLHLGGTWPELAESMAPVWAGRPAGKPFVIANQPTPWDSSRAPAGTHTFGAYCHVPLNCDEDVSGLIEDQIERFAPGFREVVLDRHVMKAKDWPSYNSNLVGGDISGGLQVLSQMWSRPLAWRDPYRLPAPGLFLCSASTPPGGGVHGLCGYHAARSVLRHCCHRDFSLQDLRQAASRVSPSGVAGQT